MVNDKQSCLNIPGRGSAGEVNTGDPTYREFNGVHIGVAMMSAIARKGNAQGLCTKGVLCGEGKVIGEGGRICIPKKGQKKCVQE